MACRSGFERDQPANPSCRAGVGIWCLGVWIRALHAPKRSPREARGARGAGINARPELALHMEIAIAANCNGHVRLFPWAGCCAGTVWINVPANCRYRNGVHDPLGTVLGRVALHGCRGGLQADPAWL